MTAVRKNGETLRTSPLGLTATPGHAEPRRAMPGLASP
jgi:hypothetical protein